MTQTYFPTRMVSSPSAHQTSHESSSLTSDGEKQHFSTEDAQGLFLLQRDSLLDAMNRTKALLGDLRKFSKESWVVKYPQLSEHQQQEQPEGSSTTTKAARRKSARRSLSFADDPSFHTDVVLTPPRKGISRSVTLSTIADEAAELAESEDEERLVTESEAHDFRVFKLDLKLGAHGSSTSPSSLVSQLEKASIANLVDDRISAALAHIDKLRQRVEDKSSKVLVTGDLNAGKSTFVNALLRKEIMPVDQQPCTTAFCEVHDAAENHGTEELHILKEGVTYNIYDESTFTRAPISSLEDFVSENENEQQMLKVYLADGRPSNESLLNNGAVDISLIDAPGLNRDSVKTTAVFARQEEIDVVVFVVSAENHFTLSAREFLTTASNEKAYVFIVVNKYDQIRDKAKCRRLILDQVRQLSPRTFEDAEDLVHFVDSSTAFHQNGSESFDSLEKDLRSFVLVKRSKSKLAPASTYLCHILSDIDLLAGANSIVAEMDSERAHAELEQAKPMLEKMQKGRETLEETLGSIEENEATRIRLRAKEILNDALDRIGQGKLGVDERQVALRMPSYDGLLSLWSYACDVRRTLLASMDLAVKLAEEEARVATTNSVNEIGKLEDKILPEGVERSRRVFMPEAMFSTRASQRADRRASQHGRGAVVAGGSQRLGIGLAHQPEFLETTFHDIFDAHHQLVQRFSDHESSSEEEAALTAISVASVGLGALTMVGGQTVGIRGLVESIYHVSHLLSNDAVRKWAIPIITIAGLGTTAYFIWDLPHSVPRNVGRRIKASLMKEHPELKEASFVELHAGRVSRETRKVLRLAGYDLNQRFRAAVDEKAREVKNAEETERKAKAAVAFFGSVLERTGEVREKAELVSA